MKNSIRQQIFRLVKETLLDKPNGMSYSQIIRHLKEKLPDVNENTLQGSVWELRKEIIEGKEKEIFIPSKGIYIHAKYVTSPTTPSPRTNDKIKEEDFYEKFADYLVNELEECTSAIALGGNRFQDKWGTPDVLGIYKFSEVDPIKPPLEILSAEIKTNVNEIITAFGQACSYKIFSHKVYLVIPLKAQNDIPKLESLCMRFGIGLILFDNENPDQPNFQIRTRASKSEPDYYYVNLYLPKLQKDEIRKLMG